MKQMQHVWMVLLVGCSPAAPHLLDETEPVTATNRLAVSADLLATLHAAAVTDSSFARRVLYTWTSDVGAARMRAERRLLLPTEREGYFVQTIDSLASAAAGPAGDVARLLGSHPSFGARRYAWTRPFATRVPLSDRSYGDHLVAVTLKPQAVIARFDAREAEPFTFQDLDGNEVPLGRVLAEPSTLAAVYHVSADPLSGVPFREYVLVNESMIAEWSMGTASISQVLAADVRTVRELAGASLLNEAASEHWAEPGTRLEDLYAASIAFDTARHRPTPENLGALARSLESVAQPSPLVVVPTVAFTSLVPAPPPVPPVAWIRKTLVEERPWRKYVCD